MNLVQNADIQEKEERKTLGKNFLGQHEIPKANEAQKVTNHQQFIIFHHPEFLYSHEQKSPLKFQKSSHASFWKMFLLFWHMTAKLLGKP